MYSCDVISGHMVDKPTATASQLCLSARVQAPSIRQTCSWIREFDAWQCGLLSAEPYILRR